MSVIDTLNTILNIKSSIKAAISNKGVEIDDSTPFEEYPSKIEQIAGVTDKLVMTEGLRLGGEQTVLPNYIDFSQITDMSSFFTGFPNLVTINQPIDCTNISSFGDIQLQTTVFYGCRNLKNVNFIGSLDVDVNITTYVDRWKTTYYEAPLSFDSVKSLLTAANNTTMPDKAKTLSFIGLTLTDVDNQLLQLTSECTAKGWTILNLILQ